MKRLLVMILLLLVSLALVNAQSKETYRDEKVAAELIALVRQWDAAISKHDAATLDKLLAAEFALSGLPKAAYLAHVKSSRNDIVSAESGEFDVRVYGDTAILIAVDEIKSGKNGETTEWYRYIDVWVKRDGRWQCVVTESSQIKKPQKGSGSISTTLSDKLQFVEAKRQAKACRTSNCTKYVTLGASHLTVARHSISTRAFSARPLTPKALRAGKRSLVK